MVLSLKNMVKYWNKQVEMLKGCRPLTPAETLKIAEEEEASAAELRGRKDLSKCFGLEGALLGHEQRAADMRRIASEPEGTRLAQTIAEAEERAAYYGRKLAEEVSETV